MSEDLVPVNITCIQDSPEVVFHITAYNSQVEKILDVRLLQPGKSKKVEVNAIRKNYLLATEILLINTFTKTTHLMFRHKNWTSVRVFYLLERHLQK